jgi:hypothetical protein
MLFEAAPKTAIIESLLIEYEISEQGKKYPTFILAVLLVPERICDW